MGLPCVYSAEPRLYPWADGTCRVEAEPAAAGTTTTSLRMDCASGFGAAMHVTATAGLMASGEVVTLSFGVSNEQAWEVGLACGGQIEVFVERVG